MVYYDNDNMVMGDSSEGHPCKLPVLSGSNCGPIYFVSEEISGQQKWPMGVFLHEANAKPTLLGPGHDHLKGLLKDRYNLDLPQSALLITHDDDEGEDEALLDQLTTCMSVVVEEPPTTTTEPCSTALPTNYTKSGVSGGRIAQNRSVVDMRYLSMGRAQREHIRRANLYWRDYHLRTIEKVVVGDSSQKSHEPDFVANQSTLLESYFITEPITFTVGLMGRLSMWK